MLNKTCFRESWLSDSRFVEWIARSSSKENAYCKFCKCVISLSNMRDKALRSHDDGKKHKKTLEDLEQVKNFFKPKNAIDITEKPNKTSEPVAITTPVDSMSAASSTSSNASHTKSLDACFQDSACQKAEIMLALKLLQNGLSDNSAKNVVGLFKTMFSDSKAAEKMQLEPSKLKYVVNHGIAPYVSNRTEDRYWDSKILGLCS